MERGGDVAVIQFPGVNCEFETARAIRGLGLRAEVVRWNLVDGLLDRFAGFILPGGFSYQDRVRAGAIASREPIVDLIARAGKEKRPILGICNGAQILVEAGLIPGNRNEVEVALAPNRSDHRIGYYCNWIRVRVEPGPSFLSRWLDEREILPLPIAHAEGRFVSAHDGLMDGLLRSGQIPLRYVDGNGEPVDEPPYCPNGSVHGAAALSNDAGNVVAMMPHPERASYLHQLPDLLAGCWGDRKTALRTGEPGELFEAGPGARVLTAFCNAVKEVVS